MRRIYFSLLFLTTILISITGAYANTWYVRTEGNDINAVNSWNNAKGNIQGKLIDIGHTANISLLRISDNRLLSRDSNGRWILWNRNNRQQIMRGISSSYEASYSEILIDYIDLKGSTLAVSTGNEVKLFSVIDGTLLTNLSVNSRTNTVGLSIDGNYFFEATNSSLSVWSVSGQKLLSCDGDYAEAKFFANTENIKVANGPSGTKVIETISLDSGNITISPNFSGDFHSWFLDGSHFLTIIDSVVYVYSAEAEQKALVNLQTTESVGGSGSYFWAHHERSYPDYPFKIYKIGSDTTPIKTIKTGSLHKVIPTENKVAILPHGDNNFTIVHLKPNSITTTSHKGPGAYLSAFGADKDGSWAVGNRSGVIYDNLSYSLSFEEKAFGYGRVRSIAGSTSGVAAVATASGQILIFNISDIKCLDMKMEYDSSYLKLSSDGTVLAAQADADDAQYSPDVSLTVFSLPTTEVIRKWDYSFPTSTGYLFDFDLSLNGKVASRLEGVFSGSWSKKGLINIIDSGELILSLDVDREADEAPKLSPDGLGSVISTGYTLTKIYEDGQLSVAIGGKSAGWIDNERLLVNTYEQDKWGGWIFSASHIYNRNGSLVSDLSLPEVDSFTPISDTKIFSHNHNAIFDLQTGNCIWDEDDALVADAVSSNYVIYEKNGELWWHKWGEPQPSISQLVFVTPPQTIIAGQISDVMTIQTQDEDGNPIAVNEDTTVNLTLTSGTGIFYSDAGGMNEISSVTIPNGHSEASFYYSDTTVGNPTISALEEPEQGWTDATQEVTVKPDVLHHFTLEGYPTATIAGEAFTNDVTVKAYDEFDNVKTDYTGTVSFSSTDSNADLPEDYTFILDNAGKHVFSGSEFTLKTAGIQTLTVTDKTAGISESSNSITVNHGILNQFTFDNINDQTTCEAFPITITAQDAYENTVTSFTDTVELTDTTGTLTPITSDNFIDGVLKDFDVNITKSQNDVTITATHDGVKGTSNSFNVGTCSLAHFIFETIASPQLAGESLSIKITAKDEYENTVTSFNETVELTDITDTLTPTEVTFEDGVWTGDVTITQVQNDVAITASYDSVTDTSNSFDVEPSTYPQINKVLSLDGDGDYVEILDDNSLDLTNTLTLEAWVLTYYDFAAIVCKGYTVESYGLWVRHDFHVGFGHNYPGHGWLSKSNSGKGKVWTHFAVSWDGQIVRFFIDGEPVGEEELSDTLTLNNEHLFLGADFPGGNEYIKGSLDEIRIWNLARTQEQIQAMMNTTLTGNEEGLVGYWNFDDGTANDLTANNNDGTLYGDARIVDQYYVSPSGNDANEGSKENPFKTIQYAIDQSGRGDVITALPGTYEENITLVGDLTLQGSGAATTIITASSGNVISADDVHNVMLSGFTIDGQGTADSGILCGGSTSYMEIANNTITNAGNGIECTDNAKVEIRKSRIYNSLNYGIYCSGESDVTIDSNEVYKNSYASEASGFGNWNFAIKIVDETKASVINNQIYENHRGISCWDNTDVTIQNNEIYGNKNQGILYYSDKVEITLNGISHNGSGINCHKDGMIVGNLIQSNKDMQIVIVKSASPVIVRNTIYSGRIVCKQSSSPTLGGSLADANYITDCLLVNHTDNIITATYNYWGTDDESVIEDKMRNEGDGSIIFKPFIGDPELIGDTSGNGEITAYDASLILQYCVGLIDQLPANISSVGGNITPRNRTISIPNVSVKTNELISLPVLIDEPEDLVAGGITIKYDQTVLRATGIKVTPESLLNDTYWKSKVDNDEIRLAFTKTYLKEPNQSKTVAMLEFEPLGNVEGMTTDLVIDHAQIAESLSIAKVDGYITFLPSKTLLLQNYPNPFNPETWIPFQLSDDAKVIVSIYDVEGQLVRKIGLGNTPAGMYLNKDKAVYWDGCNNAGEQISSGLYFYQLQAGSYSATKRMLIVK